MRRSGLGRRRAGVGSPAAVAVVTALVGGGVRLWSARGKDPLWWPDSDDYQEVASHGPFSLDLWAGARPPGVPLLLWLVGEGDVADRGSEADAVGPDLLVDGSGFVVAQMTITTLGWALLAASLCSFVASPRLRWVVAAVVLGVSCTLPVVMWERSVLTESLSMSSLVVLVAAALQLARRPRSWGWAASTLGALVWWVSFRDSHAALLLGASVLAAGWLAWRWRFRFRQVSPQCAAVLVGGCLVAALTLVGASYGNRSETPLRNLYAARVLPYEDRLGWFEDQGMPQADDIDRRRRAWPAEPGEAPVVYIGDEDPAMEEWNEWLDREGRSTYLRWAVTHPDFLLIEPTREPERAFNNADGNRSLYAPYDQRSLALVSEVLTFSTAQAFVLAAGAVAVGLWGARRAGRSHRGEAEAPDQQAGGRLPAGGEALGPCFFVGLALALLAVPHGLLAWHGDAMETARHVAIPAFQLQLGAGLLVVGAGVAVRTGSVSGGAFSGGSGELESDPALLPGVSLGDRGESTGEDLTEMAVGAPHRGDDAAAGVVQPLDVAEASQLPAVAGGAVDEDHVPSLNPPDH